MEKGLLLHFGAGFRDLSHAYPQLPVVTGFRRLKKLGRRKREEVKDGRGYIK